LSKVRYASKGLPSLLLKPLIRDVLPLVTRSAIWLYALYLHLYIMGGCQHAYSTRL
jgi:hypothetical protein